MAHDTEIMALAEASERREDATIAGEGLARLEARLVALRDRSETLWDMAVDTADSDARQDLAHDNRIEALEAWERAIEWLERGETDAAIGALQCARRLTANWGDDAPEREAIALLEGAP